MDCNAPYRNEWKYLISPGEAALLRQRLKPLLQADPHARPGGYKIRSLYFDDFWHSAQTEKEDGVLCRKKWRIRFYNDSDSLIRLERKKKFGSYILKESAEISREEAEKILAGEYGFLLQRPDNLCREFYVECVSHVLRPRVIVDYEREAWIMEEGTVRITFDANLRAAVGSRNPFDPALACLPALAQDQMILEVKFTEFLPQLLRQALPPQAAEFTAASKFLLCCQQTGYLNGFEYYCKTEGAKHK